MSLAIDLTDSDSITNDAGRAEVVLRAQPFDFLRSVTGRRARRDVAALSWSADPSTFLDRLCPYGPLPDDVSIYPPR